MLPRRLRRFFRRLGPGLIKGAADNDPSGISTYSVTGAAFGYAPLWTALFSFPLMTAVQMMCARLGMVTGRCDSAALFAVGPVGRLSLAGHGQHGQYRRRSRRYGEGDGDGDRD